MKKALLFSVSLLLLARGATAQEKPLDLTLNWKKLRPAVITYTDTLHAGQSETPLTLADRRKELLLPAAQWTSGNVTYTTGMTPRKFVFRANW